MALLLSTVRALAHVALALVVVSSAVADVPRDETLLRQQIDYDSDATKTIFELQPYRTESLVRLTRKDGTPLTARLVNLNPHVSRWYVLSLEQRDTQTSYALEAADRPLALHLTTPRAGVIALAGDGLSCEVTVEARSPVLDAARQTGLPYAPLCGGALYLRNAVNGRKTSLERITDLLRDNVWGGDRLIGFVKKELYRDAFVEKGSRVGGAVPPPGARDEDSPRAALLNPEAALANIVPERLALDVRAPGGLASGRWYPLEDLDDVWVSAFAPEHMETRLLVGHERSVNPLDAVESRALVYLVAFDLHALSLHFVLGTDHPRLDWSDRPPPVSQDARLPGPDGIASAAPLVRNGIVKPADVEATVATFAGGFKRSHGAFRHGVLAERNHGSHYGFIQEGVIFSKLQPGLATVVVTNDDRVSVRTWQDADVAGLSSIRYARQNGVPLIEYDPIKSVGVPGDLVNLWGPGNWSGSANEDLRTLRAGLCLQQAGEKTFLIYGYFSAATPSAMARVFQAYQCRFAMHLDMNALEHTYLATYLHRGSARVVAHLVRGMEEVDRTVGGRLAPRFLAFPDDRDFFYLTRKRAP